MPPRKTPVELAVVQTAPPAPVQKSNLHVDLADMILPYIKLLQGLSPEVKEDPRKFVQGEWLHTILDECMGKVVRVNVLGFVKTIELWAPRGMNMSQPLARSLDGMTWDRPHTNFDVVDAGVKMQWRTMGSVPESGLTEFGTSNPNNPKSAPAAAETFRIFLNLLDYEEASPVIYVASRTAVRPVKEMLTRLNMLRRVPHYAHIFNLTAVTQVNGPNSYFVPAFKPAGQADASELDRLKDLADMASEAGERQAQTQAAPPVSEGGKSGPIPF